MWPRPDGSPTEPRRLGASCGGSRPRERGAASCTCVVGRAQVSRSCGGACGCACVCVRLRMCESATGTHTGAGLVRAACGCRARAQRSRKVEKSKGRKVERSKGPLSLPSTHPGLLPAAAGAVSRCDQQPLVPSASTAETPESVCITDAHAGARKLPPQKEHEHVQLHFGQGRLWTGRPPDCLRHKHCCAVMHMLVHANACPPCKTPCSMSNPRVLCFPNPPRAQACTPPIDVSHHVSGPPTHTQAPTTRSSPSP